MAPRTERACVAQPGISRRSRCDRVRSLFRRSSRRKKARSCQFFLTYMMDSHSLTNLDRRALRLGVPSLR
jgi:hypothetical protein